MSCGGLVLSGTLVCPAAAQEYPVIDFELQLFGASVPGAQSAGRPVARNYVEKAKRAPHLVAALVTDNDKQGALPQLDAILHQGADARVHFLPHPGNRGLLLPTERGGRR